MNTTPLESETKDYKEFKMSLSQLYDNMLRYYKNDGLHIVIELSRKGPKIMECCPKEKRLEGISAITEFAIPFLMMTLKKGVTYHIIIVDDAIYYGSTLRNLVKELREYERVLGLRFKIIALVALIDKDAPILTMETTLFGKIGHRSGFGHYFVHHIMSRFRKLHRCMEVEFPIVTYEFGETIDIKIKKIYQALRNKYAQSYINDYPEGSVITILLQDNKTQFCKFRIYVEEQKMHLAFMSPYNLPHNKESLLHVMDSMGQEYKEIWRKITILLYDRDLDDEIDDVINRNSERSLVVLANFILSFQFFVKNRHTIEKALSDIEYDFKNYDLPEMALYRLIGNNSLSGELRDVLLNNAILSSERSIDINIKEIPYEQQLFEEEYSPSQEERNILVSHNAHMIRNSKSVLEAISAVVFNQDFFMDRWTRQGLYYGPNRHLWFGYTHDTLDTLIRRNARFTITDTLLTDLHKCIDRRIDQGCVVPQYIINPETKQWVRVFRPGENEDILLSHLARYVIHIYNLLDCKLNIGFVPLNIFDMVLAIIFKRLEGWLKKQFMFSLYLQDNKLVWSDSDTISKRNVLDYLKDMYVLEINNEEEVTIAPRISDTEFLNNTTLDSDILDKVDSLISNILSNYSKWNISFNHAESFFNYFLNEDAPEDSFKNLVTDVSKTLFDVLNQIEQNLHYEGRNAIEYDSQNKLIDSFSRIGQYEVHPNFLDSAKFEMSDYNYSFGKDQFIHYQTQFKVMSLIINLIFGAYLLEDIDDIKEYLEDNDVKRLMSTPKLKELYTYITQLWGTGREKNLLASSRFPVVLRNTLDRIIS